MSIGSVIKRLRKHCGWSQAELAEKLNVSQKVIATYETDARRPSIEKLPEIAAILGVSTDQLLEKKKLSKKDSEASTHKNRRSAKVQNLFEKLSENDQRSILKQIKGLLGQRE